MVYFPRMLDKIRRFAAGQLPADYHPYLGKGFDGRCCSFLRIDYDKLVERVKQGGTDEEIFQWAIKNGRDLNEIDFLVWNAFVLKRGLMDEAAERLEENKKASGLSQRVDIQTFADYIDVDEKRKP